jgi:osmotically inducible protein OsmC
MALSHGLTTAGNAPTSLDVTADVTLGQDDTGSAVTSIVLTVTGVVPGIDADAFTAAAEGAKAGCPISQALAGVADISVVATLA